MSERQTVRKKAPSRGSKPGEKRGGGSRKGVPNKSTQNAREAIAMFVEGNVGKLNEWLEQIAETDGPKAAFNCLMDVVEYHVPKLARTELVGGKDEEGKDQPVSINFITHQASKQTETLQTVSGDGVSARVQTLTKPDKA
jgi:hypothetical protein